MSPKLVKLISVGITPSLTKLYNECIEESQWPLDWKKGEWIPVFKKDNKQKKENYRPITTLLTVDKIFEKLICTQVVDKYDDSLYSRMTGYRKRHSCETTLLGLVENWKKATDNKEVVCILSTDMSKAFDSLSHSLTLKKLEAFGFGHASMKLMRSFFENGTNRVRMGNTTSTWKKMVRGCPQGSSFGPLLWNLFQNDMPYQIENDNVSMYVDDHQLYTMGKDFNAIRDSLQIEGQRAADWYKDNYLLANSEKFQALVINPRNINTNMESMDVSIDGQMIKTTDQMRLLGVDIDEKMNFSVHISEMCKKVSRKVGVLMRLRNMIPESAKLTIYKSSILPYLTYCQLVWHFCKSSDSKKVERIQERALRAVYRTKSESYDNLLKRAQISTLENRRLQDIAILMYKVKNKLLPATVIEIFSFKSSNYSLRNSDFNIPTVNTVKYGKHSLRYFGPMLWSKLHSSLRNSPSLTSFKKSIRNIDLHELIEKIATAVIFAGNDFLLIYIYLYK
jgi:hypothetical protein